MVARIGVIGDSHIDLVMPQGWVSDVTSGMTKLSAAPVSRIGGTGINIAVAAAYYGAAVQLISAVGDDLLGKAIEAYIASRNIDTSNIYRSSKPTGVIAILLDQASERGFIAGLAGSADEDIDASLACYEDYSNLDAMVLSGALILTGAYWNQKVFEALKTALEKAKESGLKVMFDPNIRTLQPLTSKEREAWFELCNLADIVLMSSEDLVFLTASRFTAFSIAELRHVVDVPIVLKVGQFGCSFYPAGGTKCSFMQIPRHIKPVDTTSAGDVFSGIFCAAYTQGMSIYDAAREAVEVASMVTSTGSGVEALRLVQNG
jgi:2-dehydro-3-deoxygluconokinase